MKTLRFYIRLYFMMVSQYIKARMQFRSDFYISTFAMLLLNITGLFSYWILFKSINNIDGWNYNELLFLYAFALLALTPQQLFFDNLWSLRFHLKSGAFIKYYFKPINTLFYYSSEVFDLKGLGQLAFALIIFVYSCVKLGISWTPINIIMLFIFVFSASLIMISMMIISASESFWVIESISVMELISRMGQYARYPMTIFNNVFRFIFTGIVPIAFVSYYKAKFFLRPGDTDVMVFITPFVAVTLFMIAYAVWTKGLNSYTGTGS